MSNYTPVPCSCLNCKKEMRSSDLPQHSYLCLNHLYPKKPRYFGKCRECNQDLYDYANSKKFCNSSCAAKHTNKLRPKGHPSRTKNNASRSKKLTKDKSATVTIRKNSSSLYTRISQCKNCNRWFPGKRATCSEYCLREYLSKTASERISHPCNKSTIDYKGIKLGSSFELKVAVSLDENCIAWTRPSSLTYQDPIGKLRKYFPDFYLPEYNVYLDPKNDFLISNPNPYHKFKDTDKIKWAADYNNVRIIILNKNQLNWSSIKELLCGISDSNRD